MPEASLQDRNFAIACYITSLALGETIKWQHIAYGTIEGYLEAVDKLFTDRTPPTTSPHEETLEYRYKKDYISVVMTALQKYEGVKDRRSMISDYMMHYLSGEAQKAPKNSLAQALFDWLVLGRYTGFRRSEWCQTTQTTFARLLDWPDQPSKALIITDFVFLDIHGRRLRGRAARNSLRVHYVTITWRYQKNGDHDQEITFAKDLENPRFCPVLAAVRIVLRAEELDVPRDHPIAVYTHSDGSRRFITEANVTTALRKAAHIVHHIPSNDPALNKWSSHSIRVTACNLLHRQKFSDSYIKNRLRWKSIAFAQYLRNTFYTADQHTIPLSKNNIPSHRPANTRQSEPHETIVIAAAA